MQDQCKYVRRGKAQNVFSIYGHFPSPVFGNDACHRHDRPLTRPAFSSREGPIEQPKSILYKLVQLRFSWGHRARCFLGDLRQHWCILREYVMGFFPDSPRIQKQVWVPGMCFAQLAHLELCKRIVKASPLSYIWRTYIMFDLESVKVFTRNLRRRIAPYPKELWLAFGVTIFFLACFLIYSLAFYNPGQKSSELKGRYGKHWVVILENLKLYLPPGLRRLAPFRNDYSLLTLLSGSSCNDAGKDKKNVRKRRALILTKTATQHIKHTGTFLCHDCTTTT